MNQYEGMFLIKSTQEAKGPDAIFDQIKEAITKNQGNIVSARIWAEKRSLTFPIRKQQEATYYLVDFKLQPTLIDKIRQGYRLNENILRVLITRKDAK